MLWGPMIMHPRSLGGCLGLPTITETTIPKKPKSYVVER